MARKGENIYKRKDGRWEGRYKIGIKPDGKSKYSSVYGKSYSEVKAVLMVKRVEQKSDCLLSLPKCDKKECQMLTSVQQSLLTNHLTDCVSPSNLGIFISAVTGMRIGELCALKWADIDFEKRIIIVRRTMQRIKNIGGETATKIVITLPKSKTSAREIPIPDVLYSYLEAMRSDNDNYVLTGEKIFAEPRTMQYRFKNILKKLGLPQVNFHTLRHMFATKCVDAGVDVKTLSEILGHCSVELTLNRYVHSSIERKRNCMKLFSDTVFTV